MRKNLGLIFAITLVSLTNLFSVSAVDYSNCPMGGGMMSGIYGSYGTGYAVLSWIFYVAIIGLAGAGIYWLVKSANRGK